MKRSGGFVEAIQVQANVIARGLDAKPSLLFEDRNLVAAVGMPEIEEQVVGGVVLDRRLVHRRGQRKVQQRADLLGHLAVSQVRRNGKVPISDHRWRGSRLPQERDG